MDKTLYKVLIVEDDNIISLVLENMMHKLGHNVVGTTTNGKDAIVLAGDLKPNLILMDIRLKGELDGIDTVIAIKKIEDVPVIYVTGNTDKQHLERAKETGFIDLITKPFTIGDLERSINKIK